MGRYFAGRLVSLVFVLVGVSLLTFLLGHLAPGDPAEMIFERREGRQPTVEQLEALREEMGLDQPVTVQYRDWLGRAVRGDLGESWGEPGMRVSDEMRRRLPNTLLLAGTAAVLSWIIAIPLGVIAAYRRNSLTDHVLRVGALVSASTPGFFLGYVLLIVIAVPVGFIPTSGYGTPAHLVLPALTLALGASARLTRLTRAAVLEALGQDYVRTAVAKGISDDAVLFAHALRNAMIPVVTYLALSLGGLLNGAVLVETIFAWPGIGGLASQALGDRDAPLVQGVVLLTAVGYVLVNFLTDVTYGWIDPRVRLVEGKIRG